ncbi:BLOC-1-related complex subunit 6 [Cuculus canorus]|uniref:BLOC-1-related complex subunit 6 n=1 Tax=Cuculus canorus TaxID=55661 RepID=UPI0023AAC35B|nr:BLOC-1-related complex subunit 6 [Cuculus canorus]
MAARGRSERPALPPHTANRRPPPAPPRPMGRDTNTAGPRLSPAVRPIRDDTNSGRSHPQPPPVSPVTCPRGAKRAGGGRPRPPANGRRRKQACAPPPLPAANGGRCKQWCLRPAGNGGRRRQAPASQPIDGDVSGRARPIESDVNRRARAPQPMGGDVSRRAPRPAANRGRRMQRGARAPPRSRPALPAMEEGGGRDERGLEALSLAGGGAAAAAAAAGRQPHQLSEGRRATLASALELEGTVLREGRLTQFVANNLERRIRLSGVARAGSIPAIDPAALQDVSALAAQVAAQVDELLRNVHCGLQALTALSVGCIQTYRDGVESLGEAADLSIRAMYALVARCEELDRAMQPVPALARRIRDMKGTLERLEALCK